MTDDEKLLDGITDDLESMDADRAAFDKMDAAEAGDWVGNLWGMREMAIHIGRYAERQLIVIEAMNESEKRIFSRAEWRRLTRT